MTHLDLCSGIGGFALAASWVWPVEGPDPHEVAHFVEIEPFCQTILRRHWPDAPIHGDLRTFDARPLRGRIDLCTAGYPCQPFAHPGKQRGAEDPRHLWPDVRRVVDECGPAQCLFENSTEHHRLGLDEVLDDLEALGYEAAPVGIPACAAGADHVRERLWILAYADRPRQLQPGRGERYERGWPENSGREAHAWGGAWPPEPGVARMAHGLSSRVDKAERAARERALGNAIVPQVAAEILRAMRDAGHLGTYAVTDAT